MQSELKVHGYGVRLSETLCGDRIGPLTNRSFDSNDWNCKRCIGTRARRLAYEKRLEEERKVIGSNK